MLWRGSEIGKVCDEGAPKALIGIAGLDGEARAEDLCRIAAAHLAVRFVLGFGQDLPDGVSCLDAVIAAGRDGSAPPVDAQPQDGPVLITFTARADAPMVPVLRQEDELGAGRHDGDGALARPERRAPQSLSAHRTGRARARARALADLRRRCSRSISPSPMTASWSSFSPRGRR
jgi:hypothetical protein